MSIISCFFIFLLCLSIHACNARHLAVHKESGRQVQLSGKDVLKDSVPPEMKPSSLEYLGTRRIVGGENEESMIDENYKGKFSGGVQIKSLVSVSWHVPHEKRRENPGFNLDYSPPETHPPSHN